MKRSAPVANAWNALRAWFDANTSCGDVGEAVVVWAMTDRELGSKGLTP